MYNPFYSHTKKLSPCEDINSRKIEPILANIAFDKIKNNSKNK